MAPRKAKPSSFLNKYSISVVGNLGKLAKVADIEKWTVNNGGTFRAKPDGSTTHIICSWDTFRKDDFALPKKYEENKKLHIVEFDWLDSTLQSKRVMAAKKYLHSRKWDLKARKKATRRQALLTGKSQKDIERKQVQKKFGPIASDTEQETETDQDDEANTISQDNLETVASSTSKHGSPIGEDTATQDSTTAYIIYETKTGIKYDICLKGAELPDPEEGDYVLSIMALKDGPLYKACYTHVVADEEPSEVVMATSEDLEVAVTNFEAFFENKSGMSWSEHCAIVLAQKTLSEVETLVEI